MEEEVVARDCAAEEEERKSCSLGEEGQTNIATDGEAAGSKGTTEDQMDVDNRNGDEEFVGPIPPAPDTEGDKDEVTNEENTSNVESTDCASTEGGADKTGPGKPEGQDKADDTIVVDAGPQEEGKDEPTTVGASVNEGNTAVSFDQAVSNEDNAMAPE
jgi:pre-mRNA-splicing factor CDC5/CEF1